MINLAKRNIPIDVDELNLHSVKVLQPRLMPQKKGNEVVGTTNPVGLTHDVPPLEALMDCHA